MGMMTSTLTLARGDDGKIYEQSELGTPGKPQGGRGLASAGSPLSAENEADLRSEGWIIGDKMARPVQAVAKDDIIELDPKTDEGDDRVLAPDGVDDPMTDEGDAKALVAPPQTKQITAKQTK